MKRLDKFIAIRVIIFFAPVYTLAQAHSKNWVPEKGYWVIESNIHSPRTNTFYFYNDSDSLMYFEKIENRRINIKNKATLKKLKSLLDNSLLTRSEMSLSKEDGTLVKAILKIEKER